MLQRPERDAGAEPFLTADWRNVVLISYRVPEALLLPHLPEGSELDTPTMRPRCTSSRWSLSSFRARGCGAGLSRAASASPRSTSGSTRAAGRCGRPSFCGSSSRLRRSRFGARLFYNQPYALARIRHRVERTGNEVRVATDVRRGRFRGTIRLRARDAPYVPAATSQEHFLKEHYWGFDRNRTGASFRYRVDHPLWRLFPIEEATVAFDPGQLLGGVWSGLDWDRARHSVLLAEGSKAIVYPAEPLAAGDRRVGGRNGGEGA